MAEAGQGQEQDSLAGETAATEIHRGLPVPSTESWTEWKNRCAVALCDAPVQNELRDFAAVHFALYLRRYSFKASASDGQPIRFDGDPWHLFETHLAVRNTRRGKKYKEWLFSRLPGVEQGDREALAGGAALLMRDVAREHLRQEYAPSNTISLNALLCGGDEARISLEDLLPGAIDPCDEVALREFAQLAADDAKEFFGKMGQREKVAFLAKDLGISLAHAEIEKAAGCRKSVLSTSYQAAILSAAEELKERYSAEDPASVRALILMTLQEIRNCARTWARSSAELGTLFSAAEAS